MRAYAGVPVRAAFLITGLLGTVALALPAQAKCTDPPGPHLNWAGCSKPQLMLNKDDLTGGVFSKAALTGTEFSGSKLAGAKLDEAEIRDVVAFLDTLTDGYDPAKDRNAQKGIGIDEMNSTSN